MDKMADSISVAVVRLVGHGELIAAVKLVKDLRAMTNQDDGLKSAKDVIDWLQSDQGRGRDRWEVGPIVKDLILRPAGAKYHLFGGKVWTAIPTVSM